MDSRRDFVDIDSLNRVEIARGRSPLFGAAMHWGVVSFTTSTET